MLCLHLPVLMRVSAVINCAQRYFDSWSVHFILAPTVRRHINETEATRNGAQRLPIKTKWEKLWQQEGKTKTMPPRLTTWWLDKKRRSKQKERRPARKAKCQKYATPPSREAIAERKTKKRITAATECVNNKKANKFRREQHVLQFGAKSKNRRDKAARRQRYKAAKANKQTHTEAATNQRCGDSTRHASACVRVSVCLCMCGRQNSTPVPEANAHATVADLLSAQVYTREVERSCHRNWKVSIDKSSIFIKKIKLKNIYTVHL